MIGIILYLYINSYNTFSIGGRLIRYYSNDDERYFYYNTTTQISTWEPGFRETIVIIDNPENIPENVEPPSEPPSEPPQKWICNIINYSCEEVSVDSSNDDSGSEGGIHGTRLFDDYHTCDNYCKNRRDNPGISLEIANKDFESTRTTICPNTHQLEPEPEPESETTPRRVNIDYLQKCKYTQEVILKVQELFNNLMTAYIDDSIFDITFTIEQIILLLKTNFLMISWRKNRRLFHSNFLSIEKLGLFLHIANEVLRSPTQTDTTNIREHPNYLPRYRILSKEEVWKIINYSFDEMYALLLIDANALKLGHDNYVIDRLSRNLFIERLNELYNNRYQDFHILHTTLIQAMEGRNTLTREQIENLLNHYQQNIFLLNQRELEYLHEQREINLACAANLTEEGIPPEHD